MSATLTHLQGKTILLTGGTGFLGKVIIERLLRCVPDIGRIYLLIRPQRDAARQDAGVTARFASEILASGVFASLAQAHGGQWDALARARIVPVAGDVSMPNLGLDECAHATLTSTVDIVINCAASVTFDAAIDEAIRHNTRSVGHIAEFARTCRSAVLVHVSTAYVAGRQAGTIAEAPLDPNIAATELASIEDEIAAVRLEAAADGWPECDVRARLVEAGMTRARRLGWHDNYTFTKALGEMVLVRERGDVPTAIVRPTIIESSLRHPEPGWLENLNVGDPLWVEYGRGRMTEFPLGLSAIYDLIPVDFVANAILAILPRVRDSRDVRYYAIGSGSLNPVTGADIYALSHDYFRRYPMLDRRGLPIAAPRMTFPTYAEFREKYAGRASRSATIKRLLYLADLYDAYLAGGCIFDTANTQGVLDQLDDKDRAVLDFDVRRIDWSRYIQDVHLPGLRRHVLRDATAHAVVRSQV